MQAQPASGAMTRKRHDAIVASFVIVGDKGVGKTSLLERLVDDTFDATYSPTICIDSRTWTYEPVMGRAVKCQFWDMSGEEIFFDICLPYFWNTHAVIAVYDTTCRASFAGVQRWIADTRYNCLDDTPVFILVGTKTDIADAGDRRVSTEEGRELARYLGIGWYIETSARNHGTLDAFRQLIVDVVTTHGYLSQICRRPIIVKETRVNRQWPKLMIGNKHSRQRLDCCNIC